ncbi:MAG: Bug family tripartite tricarboxylate transporter substrate binding protein [Beijerinckiaceae bacterium]
MCALAGALAMCGSASAQSWPSKPITFVVPFPAGGGTDAFARPLAAQLETQLGQRIVIENRGGAGGTVGASHAAKQPGDGYTFFIGAAHHAIAPALYPKLDYDILKDFVPVGVISEPPQVIVVNPKVPAKDLKELIALAKAQPGKLNFGSAGNGTTHHLAGELFILITGAKITHVPYRGAGPAMQDLVSGHIDVMFDGLGSSAGQIAGNNLRGIAVAAPTRAQAFPNMPTAREAGLPGYEVATWYAMWAPKGTPQPIVERMQKEIRTALASQTIREAWTRNGSPIPNLYGPEFGKFVASEVDRWGKVVRDANVKLEQ